MSTHEPVVTQQILDLIASKSDEQRASRRMSKDVVDALKIERDPSYSPVFQTMFTLLDDGAESGPALDSWASASLHDDADISWTTAKFDIDLTIVRDEDDLLASFEYSTALFDRSTMEFMGRHFVALLRSISTGTPGPVAALSALDAEEFDLVTKAWNSTTAAYPDDKCIHDFLIEQAQKTPDATAKRALRAEHRVQQVPPGAQLACRYQKQPKR